MAVSRPVGGGCVVTRGEAGTNKHRVGFGAGGRLDVDQRAAETTASLSGRVQSSPAEALLTAPLENSALVDGGRTRAQR